MKFRSGVAEISLMISGVASSALIKMGLVSSFAVLFCRFILLI